ncbi:MAG: hypothetical protein ACRDUB_11690 [Mycobacterium sp.]
MTVTLWRRNVIGGLVAAAALTTITTVLLKPDWERYLHTVQPAHTAAAQQPTEVDGQTWSIRNVSRSTRAAGSGLPLPDGTVLVNVVVERSGTATQGFGCTAYLVDGERSWRSTAGPPCGAAVSMPWSFLVPVSAEPTAVDIKKSDGSLLLRLEL